MAADLYLYALPDDAETRALFEHGFHSYESFEEEFQEGIVLSESRDEARRLIYFGLHDRVHIGPLSFLKASMDGDGKWLPGPVMGVLSVVPEDTLVPNVANLQQRVTVAMNVRDTSHYRRNRWRGGSRREVKRFFQRNPGKLIAAMVE